MSRMRIASPAAWFWCILGMNYTFLWYPASVFRISALQVLQTIGHPQSLWGKKRPSKTDWFGHEKLWLSFRIRKKLLVSFSLVCALLFFSLTKTSRMLLRSFWHLYLFPGVYIYIYIIRIQVCSHNKQMKQLFEWLDQETPANILKKKQILDPSKHAENGFVCE